MRILFFLACLLISTAAQAENIKIGILKTTSSGPIFIASAKGYFAAEGLEAELVTFESAQPVAVAAASGAIDFGNAGFTGGFYGLAGDGALRIVSGGASEIPGYHNQAFLASNKAWAAGLRSLKDMPGHSFAVSQIGSPPHYAMGLAAQKYGFDLKSVRILPLQSIPATEAALTGGQADASGATGSLAGVILARGDAKLLGYMGDETPYQLSGTFTSRKTADERGDTVRRFLSALNKGYRDYYDAFIQDGKRHDGPTAPEMLAIVAKGTGQKPDDTAKGLPYIDAKGRVDVADIGRQYEWYKAQGMIKGAAAPATIIDRRYAVSLD
ncbi:MAG TPA: ABC transporter substrate-binding protein [Stellaceae bacterium]|jgi:NitT/TauT family transport system substrate-binding protein|nr:ABC transporter substrate-binding protein [Stellaceae bacterium]